MQAVRKAKKNTKNSSSPKVAAHISRGLKEGALLILIALSIYMLAGLFSYSPLDPGWSHVGPRDVVHNVTGTLGAWFADVLLYLFGYLAYLFPFMLAYSGWLVVRPAKGEVNYWELSIRWTGFLLVLSSGTALASLHMHLAEGVLPLDAGGLLGLVVGDFFSTIMGLLGSSLILLAVFLGSVTLLTTISWLRVIDLVGDYSYRVIMWIHQRIQAYRENKEEKLDIQQDIEKRKEAIEKENKKQAIREKTNPVRIEPVVKVVEPSVRAVKEKQITLFDDNETKLPPLQLLDEPQEQQAGYSEDALKALSHLLELKLSEFNVEVRVVEVHPGPVITRFEIEPAAGIKASKITGLSQDLARSLSVTSVRVVEVIPGKTHVGLEIPNENREMVLFTRDYLIKTV